MSFLKTWYPGLALVAVVVIWGGAWWRSRRFRASVAEAAARLGGRYVPGSHTSGGELYGRLDGRDVVFTFHLGSSSRPPSTTVIATLGKPRTEKLLLKGKEAVARAPGLAPFAGFFGLGLELGVESNQCRLRVPRVVRDAQGLLDLASLAAALAKDLEG